MDKLSQEILEEIAGYADAASAQALAATCRTVRAACRRRLDPVVYLQATFQHPRALLAAMTEFDCLLSGSRALEFFVPGSSCTSSSSASNWDFLVPCRQDTTCGMMIALEAAGVRWTDPLDRLSDVGEGTTKYVPVHAVRHTEEAVFKEAGRPLCRRLLPSAADVALFRRLRERRPFVDGNEFAFFALDRDGQTQKITIATKTRSEVFEAIGDDDDDDGDDDDDDDGDDDDDDDVGRRYNYNQSPVKRMIHGTITSARGTTSRVQLHQCHAPPRLYRTKPNGSLLNVDPVLPLPYLLDASYASHVQCFLAGWYAEHPFLGLARERLALYWAAGVYERFGRAELGDQYDDDHTAAAAAATKYRGRGFRFFKVDQGLAEVAAGSKRTLPPLPPPLTSGQQQALEDARQALLTVAVADSIAGDDLSTRPADRELVTAFTAKLDHGNRQTLHTALPYKGGFRMRFAALQAEQEEVVVRVAALQADDDVLRKLHRRQRHQRDNLRLAFHCGHVVAAGAWARRPRGWSVEIGGANTAMRRAPPRPVEVEIDDTPSPARSMGAAAACCLKFLQATESACVGCTGWRWA